MRRVFPLWTLAVASVLLMFPSTQTLAWHRTSVSVWFGAGPWYPAPYYPPVGYGPVYVPDAAAVDTDIYPEDAEVWLDGARVGIADNFDGFPRYLEVSPGRHRLEFQLEGYRTLRIDLTARRGRLYRLDRELRELGEEDRSGASERPDKGQEGRRDWPDRRGEEDRGRPEQDERIEREADARLALSVVPDDAAVYLDGKLLGTASELDTEEGITVRQGEHRLEIVRPGYRTWRRMVSIAEGETRTLRATLQEED